MKTKKLTVPLAIRKRLKKIMVLAEEIQDYEDARKGRARLKTLDPKKTLTIEQARKWSKALPK